MQISVYAMVNAMVNANFNALGCLDQILWKEVESL